LSPAARLTCGGLLFLVVLCVPLDRTWGLVLFFGVGIGWGVGCGLPLRRWRAVLSLACVLFLPLLLCAPILAAHRASWAEAVRIPLEIGLRGTAGLAVGAATMASLAFPEFGRVVDGLPVPRPLAALVVQIAHQTALLADESRRIAVALRVRGARTARWRPRLRVLAALPVIWLLRLVARAERVGAAMEVRGFGIGGSRTATDTGPSTAPGGAPALVFEDVSVRYRDGAPTILSGVSLRIAAGERVALLGLNGAGKTTLLQAAAGLVPFAGRIEVGGEPLVPGNEGRVRERIGMLFGTPDDQILFPCVSDDVAFSLERRGMPANDVRERVRDVLARLGLADVAACSPHTLSQGQRQRVALAGALVAQPPLLLLDEPSASLDPVGRDELAALLDEQSAALIVATHDAAFARRVCRRFVVLDAGRVVEDSGCDSVLPKRELIEKKT